MSVVSVARAVTERGLVAVKDLHFGDVVLAKDARFHKLACGPIVSYVDAPLAWFSGLGMTLDTRLRLASGMFAEIVRMGEYDAMMTVTEDDWEKAVEMTPRAVLRPRGMIIDRGICHIALGISPVAVFGRVLFASLANAIETPVRSIIQYTGHVYDLSVEDENSFVVERFVVEGVPCRNLAT